MHRKSAPDLVSELLAVHVHYRLPAMRVQIVHNQMNGRGRLVMHGQFEQHLGELVGGPVRRRPGKVPARFGFYGAEYIRGSTAFVFVIAFRNLTRCRRLWWPDIGVQRDRPFIQANDRFGRFQWAFVDLENVLHLADVLGCQFRDAPHFFPATA